jgi:hypothetical protein
MILLYFPGICMKVKLSQHTKEISLFIIVLFTITKLNKEMLYMYTHTHTHTRSSVIQL